MLPKSTNNFLEWVQPNSVDYSKLLEPPTSRFSATHYCGSEPSSEYGWWPAALTKESHCESNAFLVFGSRVRLAHVELTGLNPNRVVDDAVHDRICHRVGSQPGVPVRLLVLRAENGRGGVVPTLHELEDEPRGFPGGRIQKPLVEQQNTVVGIFA